MSEFWFIKLFEIPIVLLSHSFNYMNYPYKIYKPIITFIFHSKNKKGRTNWESSIKTYTLSYAKLDSQWKFAVLHREPKSHALWGPKGVGWCERWEGSPRGRGHECIYGWFMFINVKNQYNIVKQLSSN